MMRIAVISTDEDSSPKVLRSSLKTMLEKEKVDVVDINDVTFLSRLFPLFGRDRKKGSFHFRLRRKIENWAGDNSILKKLKNVDAIVFCSQTPNGFWRNEYSIETLREITEVPICFYEVYFLGNAPSQETQLALNGDHGVERYDWHLAVSNRTEISQEERPPWSAIGLCLEDTILNVPPHKTGRAIVDFPRPGYDEYRQVIIETLTETKTPYTELIDTLPLDQIRKVYRESSILFLSSPEAFGVPIAECLSCGTVVFAADPSWPSAWRLSSDSSDCVKSDFPSDCFWIYDDQAHLEKLLIEFSELPENHPNVVRSSYLAHYPNFYFGDQEGVKVLLERIGRRDFT